jgi:hypothetical protein
MISVNRVIPILDALVASYAAFPMLSVWTAFASSNTMLAVEHAFRVFLVLARRARRGGWRCVRHASNFLPHEAAPPSLGRKNIRIDADYIKAY